MKSTKKDISSRHHMEEIVHKFYKLAMEDKLIGGFFTEDVIPDLNLHLPVIINFWDSLLFDTNTYKGNPMIKHIVLNRRKPMQPEHFTRWLKLWHQTIDSLYIGPVAENAKERATQIGILMQHKIKIDTHI